MWTYVYAKLGENQLIKAKLCRNMLIYASYANLCKLDSNQLNKAKLCKQMLIYAKLNKNQLVVANSC